MPAAEADERAALRVNSEFYAAMRACDLVAMDRVWARNEPALCLHPDSTVFRGRVAVMASWREFFQAGETAIHCSDVSVDMIRGLAFVSCLEQIGDLVFNASNVLVWEEASWRFVLHSTGVVSGLRGMGGVQTPSTSLH